MEDVSGGLCCMFCIMFIATNVLLTDVSTLFGFSFDFSRDSVRLFDGRLNYFDLMHVFNVQHGSLIFIFLVIGVSNIDGEY